MIGPCMCGAYDCERCRPGCTNPCNGCGRPSYDCNCCPDCNHWPCMCGLCYACESNRDDDGAVIGALCECCERCEDCCDCEPECDCCDAGGQ